MTRTSRVVLPLLLLAAVSAVLFYSVFPSRTFMGQRAAIAERRAEVARLQEEQAELVDRVARLQTPAEIERIARRDYGMILPGEEAYRVLPPAPPPVQVPDSWPFTSLPSP